MEEHRRLLEGDKSAAGRLYARVPPAVNDFPERVSGNCRAYASTVTAGALGFTLTVIGNDFLRTRRRIHVMDLRTALVEVYQALGRGAPSFTDATNSVDRDPADHINQLRSAAQALN